MALDVGGYALFTSLYVGYSAIFGATAVGIYYFIRGRLLRETASREVKQTSLA
jgi:hypothetical protein